jgi:hypothetical protein
MPETRRYLVHPADAQTCWQDTWAKKGSCAETGTPHLAALKQLDAMTTGPRGPRD